MADPKWQTHLRPLFDEVVNLMSNLALSDIADKMVSKNLLELEQFERLDDTLESGQSKKAARRLLINLMKLPEPSFNTFCDILRGFESAEDLLRLVEPVKEQLRKEEVSRNGSQTQLAEPQEFIRDEKQKQHPYVIQSKEATTVSGFSSLPSAAPVRSDQREPNSVQDEVRQNLCKDRSADDVPQLRQLPVEERSRPRSRSKLSTKRVLLLCSLADQKFSSRLHTCLNSRDVNAFFFESTDQDHLIELWGKIISEEKDAYLKRCSHCLPVITTHFLQGDNYTQRLVDAMLGQSDERGMQILSLLVDVDEKQFKAAYPQLSAYTSFPCSSNSDLQNIATSIEKKLTSSNRRSTGDVSMRLPISKPGGLPGKSAFFCGRDTELEKILSECSSPSVTLCCITGPPGIGKSSLVAEVAHKVRDGDFCSAKLGRCNKWSVLYLDARNLETEVQFATELLAKMKACFHDDLPAKVVSGASIQTDRPIKSQLTDIVSIMNYPCIVLDNCDSALKAENREGFLRFLQDLTTATKNYFMVIITLCSEDVSIRFTGAQVLHIRLRPLSEADSDHLFRQSCMHTATPLSQEAPVSGKTVERIRNICEGVPMLIRLAGALFRRYRDSMTQNEIVRKLKRRPYKMFRKVSELGFLSALYKLLPSNLPVFLHGLSLFTGSFTRQEGAFVFARDAVTFGMEVVSPLSDYGLVNRVSEEITGGEMQYYLHSLIRSFLQKSEDQCLDKQYLYFQQRYCLLQLKRVIEYQNIYDRNPQSVTRKMRGFQAILEQLASLVKPTASSSKVWGRFFSLACNRNSFMKRFFPPELRKKLIKSCLSVVRALKRDSEPKIRLVFSDVLCDLGDLKPASSCLDKVFSSLSSDAIKAKKTIRARYFFQKARLHTEKGEGDKAVSILMSEYGCNPAQKREHADFFVALGNAYRSTGNYLRAIERFSQALKWCKEFLGQDSVKGSHPDTCDVLMSIGHCQFCIRQYDESLCSFSEALSMHHCLASDVSSLALTYYQTGISRAALGKDAEARKDFEQVYRLLVGSQDSALFLLSRQVEAKLLFSQGARAWEEKQSRDKRTKDVECTIGDNLLNEAARCLMSLTDSLEKLALADSQMTLVLSENLSLLVVIYSMLSSEKEQKECLSRLRQRDLDSSLVQGCYVLSCVLRPKFDSKQLIADLPEILACLAFYSYVGKRPTASGSPAVESPESPERGEDTDLPLLFGSDSSTDTENGEKETTDDGDDWEDDVQPSPISSTASTELASPVSIQSGSRDKYSGTPVDMARGFPRSSTLTSLFQASDEDGSF
ncbi:uncharacterized protein [Oscarella lobularis]